MKKLLQRLLIQNWIPKIISLSIAIAVWFLIDDNIKRNVYPFSINPDIIEY